MLEHIFNFLQVTQDIEMMKTCADDAVVAEAGSSADTETLQQPDVVMSNADSEPLNNDVEACVTDDPSMDTVQTDREPAEKTLSAGTS